MKKTIEERLKNLLIEYGVDQVDLSLDDLPANIHLKKSQEITSKYLTEIQSLLDEVREEEREKAKGFKCEFCNRRYKKMGNEYNQHVRVCYRNPERDCDTCGNSGTEFYRTLGMGLGVIENDRDCSDCEIAETVGGKSYLTEPINNQP